MFAEPFSGKSYAEFKAALAKIIINALAPARQKYADLVAHPDTVALLLEHGADRAKELAEVKMAQIRKVMGLLS